MLELKYMEKIKHTMDTIKNKMSDLSNFSITERIEIREHVNFLSENRQ